MSEGAEIIIREPVSVSEVDQAFARWQREIRAADARSEAAYSRFIRAIVGLTVLNAIVVAVAAWVTA